MAKRQEMQERVVFVYEHFLSSLAQQVYTAVENVRINLFSPGTAAADRKKLQTEGLPFAVPEKHAKTHADVQAASQQCNTPPHRRKKSRDGAVML